MTVELQTYASRQQRPICTVSARQIGRCCREASIRRLLLPTTTLSAVNADTSLLPGVVDKKVSAIRTYGERMEAVAVHGVVVVLLAHLLQAARGQVPEDGVHVHVLLDGGADEPAAQRPRQKVSLFPGTTVRCSF